MIQKHRGASELSLTPAKRVAHFLNGHAFKPSEWGDEGLPIVRIAQLQGSSFDNYFAGDCPERCHIDSGDLLFSWSASLDSFIWHRGPAYLNQHIFKVIPKEGANLRYLFYSLKHYAPIWADHDAHGSTMRHIKRESLSNPIWIPTYTQQVQLADFLDRESGMIDDLVRKQKAIINLLESKRQTFITNVVIKGKSQSAPLRPSQVEWLGEIPAHWTVTRIANLFREANHPSCGEQPILSVSIHHGVSDDELSEAESGRKVTRSEDRSKYKAVEPGDLVYNMMRAWQGGFGAVTVLGAVSPAYVVARPQNPRLAEYIELVLRTPNAIAEMKRHSRGITDFRMRLYWDEFKDIQVPVPPEDEMLEILERVRQSKTDTARVVDAASRMNNLLQERRSALISAAVTGKIDVREYGQNKNGGAA